MKILSGEVILSSKKDVKRLHSRSAVYFLISNNEIVYVGKSWDYVSRISNHIKDGVKIFDSYSTIEVHDDLQRSLTEAYYINKFSPKYNIALPSKSMSKKIDEIVSPIIRSIDSKVECRKIKNVLYKCECEKCLTEKFLLLGHESLFENF